MTESLSTQSAPERLVRKKLVIHSGTFKTGSTAIQLYLDRAEKAGLLAKEGVIFPMTGRTSGVQHANLVSGLVGDGVYLPHQGGWERLASEVVDGGAHTTIVSAEALSTLQPEHLARVAEILRPHPIDVHWVQYVRDQSSLYNAFYVERLITMRPDTLELINRPFEEFGEWSPTDLGFFRFATFVDNVRAALPDAQITLRPFVRDHMVGGDSVEDFCHTVGIPFVPELGGRANVGSGWRTVETARRLLPYIDQARLGSRLGEGVSNRRASKQKWLQTIRGELVTAGTAVGWNQESAIYMTPELHHRIVADYHEENARLDAQVDFPWLEIIESRPMKERNVGEFADVSGEELLTVLARVLSQVYDIPEAVRDMVMHEPPAPPRSFARRAASGVKWRVRRALGR